MWTRHTGVNPYSYTISVLCSFTYITSNNLVHGTYGLTSYIRRTKQLSVLLKDTSAVTSLTWIRTAHADNTRTRVRCTGRLGHDTPHKYKNTTLHIIKLDDFQWDIIITDTNCSSKFFFFHPNLSNKYTAQTIHIFPKIKTLQTK